LKEYSKKEKKEEAKAQKPPKGIELFMGMETKTNE